MIEPDPLRSDAFIDEDEPALPPPLIHAYNPEPTRSAQPFRPTQRHPMALLTVYDDGRVDGELLRIRGTPFVIGRTEGHLKFPDDGQIADRHLEITCQVIDNVAQWEIVDLPGSNGLFIRVRKTVLADGTEILVGNGRYRFALPVMGKPTITERIDGRPHASVEIADLETWIGSDAGCPIARPHDTFCEPWHVRIHLNNKGVWMAEHNKTLNGLWYRVPRIAIDDTLQFQIGEQRFKIKV